jgi:NADH-quinone oxidoreductase subunit H
MTPETKGMLLLAAIRIIAVFTVLLTGVAMLTLMERKVCAWMQDRLGPNRVGPGGLLQPAADGLKNILKEETIPAQANRVLFLMAPAFAFIPALMTFAVIPFAAPLRVDFDFTLGPLGRFVHHGMMPMAIADVPIGFLFILAISSMGVYGIALAGWASNNKYSLLGGIRATAQMVSYEVAMGMSLIPVLLLTGNVALSEVVRVQAEGLWFVVPLFLSFFVFLVSGFAETNRLPFDMPEAESELIAGYHTEYSAMKFSMFFIAEYSAMVTISALTATLFFGGWNLPFTDRELSGAPLWVALSFGWFFVKMFFWIFFIMWIRWTLPRFRYDQLMSLGWKVLMPLALAYIMVIAVAVFVIERVLGITDPTIMMGALGVLNLVLAVLVFWVLDRGNIVSGSVARRDRILAEREARRLEPSFVARERGAPVTG